MKTRLYSFLGLLGLAAAAIVIVLLLPAQAQPGANCSADYYVDETLPNGAQWQMCWEHRTREGIVFHDIYYTPPDGETRKILTQATISQIHVPYDDNGARFHDVTDYGMGGLNMNNLKPEECPNGGSLLVHTEGATSKNVMCKRVARRGHAYIGGAQRAPGYALSMFSVSPIGEHNHLPLWQFYDDGTIDLAMGASGRLQRRGTDNRYGWPIRFGSGTTGISHIHNYYWRLDFDLAGTPEDDIVEEIEFIPNDNNQERSSLLTALPMRRLLCRTRIDALLACSDDAITNDKGQLISYHIEPLRVGHRDVGPSYEPFTENDFYVTVNKNCEQFVSHNPILNNCGENVTGFLNDESLDGQDVVLWYGLTFHHIPRDEDESFMNMHWDGFRIIPRDWNTYNPLVESIPTATPVPTETETPLPTDTPAPDDTDTPVPTETPVPIDTDTPVPTETPVPTSTSLPAGAEPTIRMGSYEVSAGGEFTATIDALGLSTGVATMSMEVIYDPTLLEVVSCTKDPDNLFGIVQCNAFFETDTIRFNVTGIEGVSGDIEVANIVFKVVDGASGKSPLDLNIRAFADENGDPIAAIVEDGSASIGSTTPLGDVNCDTRVDAIDGLFILQRDIGLRPGLNTCPVDTPPSSMYLDACDVDSNGNCGAVDALFILQCDIGINNVLCPE